MHAAVQRVFLVARFAWSVCEVLYARHSAATVGTCNRNRNVPDRPLKSGAIEPSAHVVARGIRRAKRPGPPEVQIEDDVLARGNTLHDGRDRLQCRVELIECREDCKRMNASAVQHIARSRVAATVRLAARDQPDVANPVVPPDQDLQHRLAQLARGCREPTQEHCEQRLGAVDERLHELGAIRAVRIFGEVREIAFGTVVDLLLCAVVETPVKADISNFAGKVAQKRREPLRHGDQSIEQRTRPAGRRARLLVLAVQTRRQQARYRLDLMIDALVCLEQPEHCIAQVARLVEIGDTVVGQCLSQVSDELVRKRLVLGAERAQVRQQVLFAHQQIATIRVAERRLMREEGAVVDECLEDLVLEREQGSELAISLSCTQCERASNALRFGRIDIVAEQQRLELGERSLAIARAVRRRGIACELGLESNHVARAIGCLIGRRIDLNERIARVHLNIAECAQFLNHARKRGAHAHLHLHRLERDKHVAG